MAADEAPDALAGHLDDLFGEYQLAVVGDGGVDHGVGQDVRRDLVERAGPGQDLIGG